MKFTKMHGLGNDYLYVFGEVGENIEQLSIKLSDRHFGVGSDGMIYICKSDVADFKMRIFNADGSEAKMCGNGIRCVGKYVYDKGYTDKSTLKIETLSGIKTLELEIVGGKVKRVAVDMGKVTVGEELELNLCGEKFRFLPVNVGNPHAVTFVDNAEKIALEKLGPLVEHDEHFPGGVNAEFVSPKGDNRIRMRVWERGSGITLACGTGACASAAAAVSKGICSAADPVFVELDGGTLKIELNETGEVIMTGPAEFICEGEVKNA